MELLVAVKKQKRLLDVLRQQVAVLDSAAAIRSIEDDVLDFGVGDSGGYAGGGGSPGVLSPGEDPYGNARMGIAQQREYADYS